MNSLNILSSRVIGQTPQSPISAKYPRSRSVSEGIRDRESSGTQGKRSASQHAKAGRIVEDDSPFEQEHDPSADEEPKQAGAQDYDAADEKTLLLGDMPSDGTPEFKPSKSRPHRLVKQLVDALTETLKWVLWKLASPGVYLMACFYDEEGNFSPLLPIRRTRRVTPGSNSQSTAHAVGLSRSDNRAAKSEKRLSRSSTLVTGEERPSTPTTSESEFDEKRQARRLRSQETVPARRSIRIKLNNEDSTRRRKQKKAQETVPDVVDSTDTSEQAVAAAILKSPTSPTSSLRITKYPHAPAPPRPLVPRRQPSYSAATSNPSPLTQKTLVIDLDETLIHSLSKGGRMSSGHMVEVKLAHPAAYNGLSLGPQHPILYYVHKRPHCDDFLRKVCKWYNLVVFTASVQEYADPVIDWLEQERKYFSARYYRQHCTFRNGCYIKDLSSVEPDLSKVMILDNSPLSYIFHEDNAIPIEGWINDPTDNDLLHLVPLLEALQYVTDVRALLALRRGEVEAIP